MHALLCHSRIHLTRVLSRAVHIYVRRVAYEPLPAADYGITLLQRLYQLFQDACLVALVVSLCYVCLACCGDGSLVPTLGSGDDERRTRGKFRGDHEDSLQAAGVDMEAFARRAEARARIAKERKAELAAAKAQEEEAEEERAEREPLLKTQQPRYRDDDDPAFDRMPSSSSKVVAREAAAGRAAVAAGWESGGGDDSPRQAWGAPEWRSAPQPPPQAQAMRPQPPQPAPMQPLHARVAPREPAPYAAEGTDSPRSPQSPPSPGSPSRPVRGFGRAPPLAERTPFAMQPAMAAAAPSRPRPAVVAPSPDPVSPSYPPAPTRPRAQMPPGGWAQPPRPKPATDADGNGRPVSPAPHAAAGMPQGRRARPRPQYAETSPPRPPGGDGL